MDATFTFNDLKDWDACASGYKTLAKNLDFNKYGKDTPITFIQALESNGVEDCLWAAQEFIDRNPKHELERDLRLFACDCAERVLPIFEKENPGDDRPRKCIEVSRLYAVGEVDDSARAAAGYAAGDAARAAAGYAAWDAAGYAAWDAARAAAGYAAGYAAWDAARYAARDAARAAAGYAAWDAAGYAAWDAEKEWQLKKLKEILKRYS